VDLLWLASWAVIAVIGWVMYRFVRMSKVGVILWCCAAALLIAAFWVPLPDDAEGLRLLCAIPGPLLPVSSIVFLVAATKDPARRAANCGGCMLAVFTLVIWIAAVCTIREFRSRQESVEQTTTTLVKLHELAAEIELIRARLGRLPEDEKELVEMRGKPMPTFYGHFQIQYLRDTEGHYQLSCSVSDFWGSHWDLFGWIVSYYGPSSTPRLRVILF
jgi:hypothetical protein